MVFVLDGLVGFNGVEVDCAKVVHRGFELANAFDERGFVKGFMGGKLDGVAVICGDFCLFLLVLLFEGGEAFVAVVEAFFSELLGVFGSLLLFSCVL